MPKKTISIASLDLFWMPRLGESLARLADIKLFSTWSSKNAPTSSFSSQTNAVHLNFGLMFYKRLPALQRGNVVYHLLCQGFDSWLLEQLENSSTPKPDLSYILSGVGLRTMRYLHKLQKPVVIESGSTHTDFQHEIVHQENLRNGIRQPLFPQSYRDRVREEFIEADFIQVPSQFVKNTYLEAGIPEQKLLLARYGTDVSRFACRTEADMAPKFRVICSSGVNLRKGARILVDAWRKLGWRDAELHWVGWPGHPQVRHLFRDPPPNVVWHGWMPHSELSALYRSCDVKVLPSFEEGLARVLIEAAASGLPLIATPNTGIEDFFTPGDPEGWLIEAGSVDALCSALEQAKNERTRTFALGQRAAARARSGFSWEDYGKQVRTNFGKVMGS